jgi:hypothetical protein
MIIAWFVLAGLLWQLRSVRDVRSWRHGTLSGGALASVGLAVTDLVELTFLAAALFMDERKKEGWANYFSVPLGLAR